MVAPLFGGMHVTDRGHAELGHGAWVPASGSPHPRTGI
jgi:hypothetical protein